MFSNQFKNNMSADSADKQETKKKIFIGDEEDSGPSKNRLNDLDNIKDPHD